MKLSLLKKNPLATSNLLKSCMFYLLLIINSLKTKQIFLYKPVIALLMIGISTHGLKAETDGVCPNLSIHGSSSICGSINFGNSPEMDYESSYSNYYDIHWVVQGGYITKVDGVNMSDVISMYNANYRNSPGFVAIPYATQVTDWTSPGNQGGSVEIGYEGGHAVISGETLAAIFENLFAVGSEGKNVSIVWDTNIYTYKSINIYEAGTGFAGVCGNQRATLVMQNIQILDPNNYSLTASNLNPICTDMISITGMPGGADAYYWNAPNASIVNNWNLGVNINNFKSNTPSIVWCTYVNDCNNFTKSITINPVQPNVGVPQQNGHDVGNVIPNCEGDFWLGMNNWISSSAFYSWNLPNPQSGVNLRNITDRLPVNVLQDFNGSVTVSGICGPPVIKYFTIKARQQATIPGQIFSCSNTVNITADNVPGNNCSWWSTNGGNFTNQTCHSATFNAPGPGSYNVVLGTTSPIDNCYNVLQTTVIVGSGTNNNGISGWQSGELSETFQAPGSNVLPDYNQNQNQKIYFAGRDGKLYYYAFDSGFSKWILYNVPGITDVTVPAVGKFTKIGYNFQGTIPYLYYINNQNRFIKIDMTSYATSFVVNANFIVNDFALNGSGEVYAYKADNAIVNTSNPNISLTVSTNAVLKDAVYGLGLVYIANNNLYSVNNSGIVTQLTTSGDVHPSTDVVDYGTNLYFVKGATNGGNLFNLTYTNLSTNQITWTYNLSGVLTVNPNTGTIYYGAAKQVISTYAMGAYEGSDIYEAYYTPSNFSWNTIKATNGSQTGGIDMYIHGAAFSNGHLYYVGDGYSPATGNQLQVWNLFYLNGCTPSVLRTGNFDASNTNVDASAATNNIAYPNPFINEITVDLSNYLSSNGTLDVELFNANGVSVYAGKAVSAQTSIVTENYPSGMYILIVKQDGKVVLSKKLTRSN